MKKQTILIVFLAIASIFNTYAQKTAYVTTSHEPWGQTGNIQALNTIFGTEGTDWEKIIYGTKTVEEIFTSNKQLIFIEGGDSNTSLMINLLNSGWPAIESWISEGGTLIVNAATNEINEKFEIGSSGIYSERILVSEMKANVDPIAFPEPPHVHPLLVDPEYPSYYDGEYSGNYVAHNVITGNYTSSVFTCSEGNTLVEKIYDSGRLLVGGLTLPFFTDNSGWQPPLQMSNFLFSMLSWVKELDKGFESFTGSTLTADVLDNDTDEFGNPLSVLEVPHLDYGTFSSFNLLTGEFVYEAPVDWAGSFQFVCTISNGTDTYDINVTITVIDNIIPIVITNNIQLQLDQWGYASLTTEEIDNGSYDNIGITEFSIDKSEFGCNDVGINTVVLTATDEAGNSSQATALVTVSDPFAPEIITEESYHFSTLPEECGAIVDIQFTTADNCKSSGNIAFNGHARGGLTGWNMTDPGHWIAEDEWFITKSPLAGKNQVIDLLVHGYDAETLDNSPEIHISEDFAGSSPDNNNTYYINIELLDANGNNIGDYQTGNLNCTSDIQTFSYTFSDYGEGVRYISIEHGSGDTELEEGQEGTRMKNLQVRVDVPDITPNLPIQQTDGRNLTEIFPAGTTTNSYIVMDEAGNTGTAEFDIIVTDDTPFVLECQPITVYLRNDGTYQLNRYNLETIIKVNTGENSMTDNCTPAEQMSIQVSQMEFNCEQASLHVPVTVTVTDAAGNISTGETTVWVIDPHAPKAESKDTVLYLDENGRASLTASDLDAGTTDACGIKEIWLDKYEFDCSNVGENTITFYANDVHNNWSSSVSTVTIIDNTVPKVTSIDDLQFEIEHGATHSAILYPELVSIDNCGVQFELIEGLGPDGLFPVGSTTETWSAKDLSGNETIISFVVTVSVQNTAPTVAAPVANQWVLSNQLLKIPLNWNVIFNDADDDNLTGTISTDKDLTTINWLEIAQDTIFVFPSDNDSGCINITLDAADNFGGTASHTFSVCIEKETVGTGIHHSADLNVVVYPNPASRLININAPQFIGSEVTVRISDMNGRLLVNRNYNSGENITIDVSDKPSGLYLIHLHVDDKQIIKKLIIK